MSNDNDIIDRVLAGKGKCGHQDVFAYLANTYCKKCADEGYRKATGNPSPTQRKRKR